MLSGTRLSTKTIKKVKPVVYALDKDRDERKINDLLFEADFGTSGGYFMLPYRLGSTAFIKMYTCC